MRRFAIGDVVDRRGNGSDADAMNVHHLAANPAGDRDEHHAEHRQTHRCEEHRWLGATQPQVDRVERNNAQVDRHMGQRELAQTSVPEREEVEQPRNSCDQRAHESACHCVIRKHEPHELDFAHVGEKDHDVADERKDPQPDGNRDEHRMKRVPRDAGRCFHGHLLLNTGCCIQRSGPPIRARRERPGPNALLLAQHPAGSVPKCLAPKASTRRPIRTRLALPARGRRSISWRAGNLFPLRRYFLPARSLAPDRRIDTASTIRRSEGTDDRQDLTTSLSTTWRTPSIAPAISTARWRRTGESTAPASVTTPSCVSTSSCSVFNPGSAKSAALTFAVSAASSRTPAAFVAATFVFSAASLPARSIFSPAVSAARSIFWRS